MRDITIALLSISTSAWLFGCGTVAGNPKKPGNPPTPPAGQIVYQLPLLDFALPEAATEDGAEFLLQDDGSPSLMRQWGKRLARVTKNVDAFSARLNKLIEKDAVGEGEDLSFASRGDGKISGTVQALTGDAEFAYRATVCYDGQPFKDFRWSADGTKILVTKSLAVKTDTSDDAFALTTRFKLAKIDGRIVFDAANEGAVLEADGEEGAGLVERAFGARSADGELTLRAAIDRYEVRPEAFKPDVYLTGRAKGTGELEFVGYAASLKVLCKTPFDETTPSWAPEKGGPRHFCFGRPKGKKRFADFDEYLAVLKRLEPIGIVKASDLGSVALPAGLACP